MSQATLLDTHAFVWARFGSPRLTPRAHEAIIESAAVYISAASIFEIAQKARIGKWPEIVQLLPDLARMHEEAGGRVASIDAAVALTAGQLIWDHRDPFDRLIAATALERKLALVSADAAFDMVVTRIW